MAIVDILLASYNGELYIESQLLSLIGQRFKDWRLLIHDDSSTDATTQIIKKWSEIDSRICLIKDDINCGSAAANFMHLVKFATADFVMFCDQDDIWFDNKIETMLETIQAKSQDKPYVVYSNSYVWLPEKGIVGKATLTFPEKVEEFLFLNSGMQGCVAIFNRPMAKLLAEWNGKCAMHDHLLHLFGITLGEVKYMSLCLMLYRNHERNVTGKTSVSINELKKVTVNKKVAVVDRKHYNAVSDFFDIYGEKLSKHDYQKIKLFLKLSEYGSIKRCTSILFNGYKLFNSSFRLFIKILLRPYIN